MCGIYDDYKLMLFMTIISLFLVIENRSNPGLDELPVYLPYLILLLLVKT